MYQREGLVVDSQTLWDQLNALARHLLPSYQALRQTVFTSPLIHADETHWYLLDKGPGKKWYAWTVASAQAVYHQILPSRSAASARQVLGDYKGIVLVDGYAAYQTVTKPGADGPASCSLVFCRVGGDVTAPTPHSPGRADFPHPVLHGAASLAVA